jgi:hypothetical protein
VFRGGTLARRTRRGDLGRRSVTAAAVATVVAEAFVTWRSAEHIETDVPPSALRWPDPKSSRRSRSIHLPSASSSYDETVSDVGTSAPHPGHSETSSTHDSMLARARRLRVPVGSYGIVADRGITLRRRTSPPCAG